MSPHGDLATLGKSIFITQILAQHFYDHRKNRIGIYLDDNMLCKQLNSNTTDAKRWSTVVLERKETCENREALDNLASYRLRV